MKSSFSHILILFMLLVGCGSDDPSPEPPPLPTEVYLSVNPGELASPLSGGSLSITVISGTSWEVSSGAEWLSTSAKSGGAGNVSVSITVAANYTGADRSAELTFTAGSVSKKCTVSQDGEITLSLGSEDITIRADGGSQNVTVASNMEWAVSTGATWLTFSPQSGAAGNRSISVSAAGNYTGAVRTAELTFTAGAVTRKCTVSQDFTELPNYVPDGYSIVWQDEFESSSRMPDMQKWWYETGNHGWGNNELENYIAGARGQDTCALISDGVLKIIAKKVGSEVLSIRMNTDESWTYGYFEARMKLPSGRGTWPAFWMLPKNFQNWPGDGEIDIMEEVGYDPNRVSSTIHCQAYNHSKGTQKGASRFVATAQTDFHIYAVEWTEDYIYGLVDGVRYFTFENDKKGNNDTWPFNVPFYLKLNLAWGGDWGGAQGVDESVLPATYEIDYVRVYQK
ncbi:MAG: family 16 glycosylhydrolase [Tannerella sp.]|jgi:hypothetical protein|nr:family 16 glycosylhydrolase [Tannerella sp.]